MQKILLIFFFSAASLFAQTGYPYLSRVPDLPKDACSMTGAQRQDYMDNLNKLLDDLTVEITAKHKAIETDVENSRPEIEKNIAKEYGLSDTDVQKLKNKKMTKEEKREMADKMLREKGLSMNKVEKLKNMSEEERKQWARGYANHQMTNTQGNPNSDMEKNRKMYDLMTEQKSITDRIHASDVKFMNQLQELDKEDSAATLILDKEINPLLKKLNSGVNETEARQIENEVLKYEKEYCDKLTPHLIMALGDASDALHKFMPDYKRLEEITAELNKATMKTDKTFSSPGLMQMEAVQSYAQQLQHVFKYAKYSFSEATSTTD